jgi:hypothetical protein
MVKKEKIKKISFFVDQNLIYFLIEAMSHISLFFWATEQNMAKLKQ